MIDQNTGLPGLPDGFFWRITRGAGSEYVELQIRRRRWFGSKKCADWPIQKSRVSVRTILEAAQYALDRFDKSGKRHKRFVGDYPPKKLVVPGA